MRQAEPPSGAGEADEHLVYLVVLHNAFHFPFSDVGVFLFTRARWAVDSSMYVFNWVVAESVSNDAHRCLG